MTTLFWYEVLTPTTCQAEVWAECQAMPEQPKVPGIE